VTSPSTHQETPTETIRTTGLKIPLLLGIITFGLIVLIVYQFFWTPVSLEPERKKMSQSIYPDRPVGTAHQGIAVEVNLIKPPSDLPSLKLSDDEERPSSSKQAGRDENQSAVEKFQEGRYEAAVELLRKAHDLDPMNPVYTKNLAYAKAKIAWNQISREEYETALIGFQEATTLHSQEPLFYLGLGLSYHHLKDETQAKEAAEKASRLAPNEPGPYKLLGEIAYQNDELQEALGYFERALRLGPDDPNLSSLIDKLQRELQVLSRFQQQATFHFTIKFEGHEERDVADEMIRILEEAYSEIGKSLSYYPDTPITVILYSDQQFRDITRTPSWTGGLFDGKIRIPTAGAGFSSVGLSRILYHEYTHAIVYALTGGRIPTWLNEGLALNLENGDPTVWNPIFKEAVRNNRLIPLQALHGSFMDLDEATASVAYAESYAAVKYLVDRYGLFTIQGLLKDLSHQSDFAKVFEDRLFIPYSEFQTTWQKSLTL